MRFPLALRIVLVQLVFLLGAGYVAVTMVRGSFEEYRQQWQHEIASLPQETLFQPLANEVARSMLTGLQEGLPEIREARQARIADGLRTVLDRIPSVQRLLILDNDRRIQFAPDPSVIGLGFTSPDDRELLASAGPVRRVMSTPQGPITKVMMPVYEKVPPPGSPPADRGRRLGSVIVWYRRDPALLQRVPIDLPSIPWRQFALPVTLFLAAMAFGGILISAVISIPVRRLDNALADYRARGFKGGLHLARAGIGGELSSAVDAITELSGAFERLDALGREREALLGTLSESLEDGMLAVDPDGTPITWNPAALRLLSPGSLQRSEGESGEPPVEEVLADVLRRNPDLPAPEAGPRELELLREDDSRIPLQVTCVPFDAGAGRSGSLFLLRDLVALRDVETHLLEAGRYAVLAHLAAGLAHEIRNPLHSIGLNAGAVQEYVKSDLSPGRMEAIAESLSTIQQETRRLTDLLNNYLGLVRPAAEAEPVDVRDLCRRVIKLLDYTAQRSRVEILLEGEENLPRVEGVADRLQQAILNLVLNAIQAMPEGGEVRLRTSSEGGLVRVTVSDTGPGLPKDVEEHLFEVRMTTKPGGTGLGLPLVRMIAEAHGGSVWYRSSQGQGAAFTLILPGKVASGVRA